MELSIENIRELSPKIIDALLTEKEFLQREIQSTQEFINGEVDRISVIKSPDGRAVARTSKLSEEAQSKLCTLCQKKKGNLCRICKSKAISAKTSGLEKVSVPVVVVPEELKAVEVNRSKLKSRLQDARDEHFFMEDE